MASTMYDLRDRILELDSDERANLLALIEREELRTPFQAKREDDEVWQALVRVSPPGAVAHRSLAQFVADKHHGVTRKLWAEAVALLGAFAAQATPVRRRDEDRAALVDLALEALAADLGRDGRVNPKALIEALPQLHRAVDRAYPGYVEAGLLHRLIRLAPQPAA